MWQHRSFALIKNLSLKWLLICAKFINFYLFYCLNFLLEKESIKGWKIAGKFVMLIHVQIRRESHFKLTVTMSGTVRNKVVFMFLIFLLFCGVNWSELGEIHIYIESGAFEWVQGLIKHFVVCELQFQSMMSFKVSYVYAIRLIRFIRDCWLKRVCSFHLQFLSTFLMDWRTSWAQLNRHCCSSPLMVPRAKLKYLIAFHSCQIFDWL